MRAALVALLGMAAAGEAATLRAALPNGRNLTLHAAHTSDTPSLPSALTQYSLVFAGDGCSRLRSSSLSMPGGGPFALVARRGNCSFDAKMRVARHAGAAALLVADSIDNLYALTNDTTAAASSSVGAGADADADEDDTRSSTSLASADDTRGGGWRTATMALRDACAVSCDSGRGVVDMSAVDVADVLAGLPGRCTAMPRADRFICPTNLCAFSSLPDEINGREREVCCVSETGSIQMAFPETLNGTSADAPRALPAVHMSIAYGERLEGECGPGGGGGGGAFISRCQVWLSEDEGEGGGFWDGSAALIWLIGVGTAALAAYLAASAHDEQDREVSRSGSLPPAEIEEATLDAGTAVAFLAFASTFLIILYLLLRAGFNVVLLLLNCLFLLASSSATASVAIHPLVVWRNPSLATRYFVLPFLPNPERPSEPLTVSYSHALAFACAFGIALSWFLRRREPWMWLLQDMLSMSVCILFVGTLRLPSLRVASIFLGLMFAYDVFMVFISPLLFHTSIMVAVATVRATRRHRTLLRSLTPRLHPPRRPAPPPPRPRVACAFAPRASRCRCSSLSLVSLRTPTRSTTCTRHRCQPRRRHRHRRRANGGYRPSAHLRGASPAPPAHSPSSDSATLSCPRSHSPTLGASI